MNLGTILAINEIEKKISDGTYDYLVDWNDDEYSIVHVVEHQQDIDFNLEGWHLWLVKYPNEDTFCNGENTIFIQNAVGPWGNDHHILTEDEINNFVIFFMKCNYKINKIK